MQTDQTRSSPSGEARDHLLLRLSHSVKPRNWPALVTLSDAVCFIKGLDESRRRRPAWEQAVERVVDAAIYGRKSDIEAATRCFEVALREDDALR